MSRLYEYTGSVSSTWNNEIVLYVHGNEEIPPTRLNVYEAMQSYINDLYCGNSEERYYTKTFRYDSLLNLREIVIPSNVAGSPAKIITQARIWQREPQIFGNPAIMDVSENELQPMSREEQARYRELRMRNEYDKFYYMR